MYEEYIKWLLKHNPDIWEITEFMKERRQKATKLLKMTIKKNVYEHSTLI